MKHLPTLKQLIVPICIFFVAIGLRLWQLPTVSPGFSGHQFGQLRVLDRLLSNTLSANEFKSILFEIETGPIAILESIWLSIAGISVWSLRFLPAVVGALSIVGFYLFGSKVIDKTFGIFFALILSGSLWHLTFSRYENLEHIAPMLVGALSLWQLVILVKEPKKTVPYVVLGLLTAAAFYLYASTQVFIVLVPLTILYSQATSKRTVLLRLKQLTVYLLTASILLAPQVAFNLERHHWLPIRKRDYGQGLYAFTTASKIPAQLAGIWKELFIEHTDTWVGSTEGIYAATGIILLVVGTVLWIFSQQRRKKALGTFLLVFVIVSVLPGILGPVPVPFRRIMFIGIPMAFLMAYGLWAIFASFSNRLKNRFISRLVFFVIAALCLSGSIRYFKGPYTFESMNQATFRTIASYRPEPSVKTVAIALQSESEREIFNTILSIENRVSDNSSSIQYAITLIEPNAAALSAFISNCESRGVEVIIRIDQYDQLQQELARCTVKRQLYILGTKKVVAYVLE